MDFEPVGVVDESVENGVGERGPEVVHVDGVDVVETSGVGWTDATFTCQRLPKMR